jgi:mRNA-degrading endonuclease toxin of MazEF toxin-antitoxin module
MRDQSGRNAKRRTGVIVTPSHEIREDEPFVVVAVTGTFQEPLDETQVPLPWNHDPRRVRTRLTKPVVAKCDWLVVIRKEDVEAYAGIVPPAELNRILEQVAKLRGRE